MPGHDENAPKDHAAQDNTADANRELHRRTRTRALTVSALTLAATWAGYSWAQAHREGLLFRTEDVALALVSSAVLFAAGAALGGAARPVRRRHPRLAAYVTLLVPVVGLGATAANEATDTQVLAAGPVVDVLSLACAVLLAALFWVRLTKARAMGTPSGGWTRGPWPAWLAGIAIVAPVMLVGGTAGLAAHQATIVRDFEPVADGEVSSGDGRPGFTPAEDAVEHRYPEVAAAVNHSARDMVTIAAQLQSRAGTERLPRDWTESFTSWDVHERCLEAAARVWLPLLHGEMSRHCDAFGRFAGRDPAETVYRDVFWYAKRRCAQLAGDSGAEPTFWLRQTLPADSPVRDPVARIEARAAKAVTDETCDPTTKGRD